MIVCDFIDKNVENFIKKDKSKRIILTFFKEPFDNYKRNKVVFIDDILNEEDYRNIDESVDEIIKIAEEIFSKYLEVNGYKLFDYLQLQAKRNLSKIYRLKYCIDKILKKENKTIIYYFSSELELYKWLRQDYIVKKMYRDRDNLGIKVKIKNWLKSSYFANFIFDRFFAKLLFGDYQNKSGNILWMGGRTVYSLLIKELYNKNCILLLPQIDGGKLNFIRREYKFNLLRLKRRKLFDRKWNYLKSQYEKGINKIALKIGLNPELVEIIFRINKNIIKDLLLALIILEDNKDMINLLIVEQSVIGKPSLAVDFFNKNKFLSIEILHGVPGGVEVGKTNKIAVYGQRDKLFLSSQGVDESKIQITGCPYYDRIFKIKKEEKSYDFLLLILDGGSTCREFLFKQIINMHKLLKYFQIEKLVIKLHPFQTKKEMDYIYHLSKKMIMEKNRVKVIKEGDTIDLLKDAKIVYNYSSSVGVEALLMNKPLIVLDYPGRKFDFEKYGGCLVAKNYEELLLATKEILKDIRGYLKKNKENIEKTRRYFSGDLGGKSYKNVERLINEMLYK